MATVVYNSQPGGAPQLDFTDAEEESLTAFLTPQWRFDQENMAHDAITYQQTGYGIDPDWSLYPGERSANYGLTSNKYSLNETQIASAPDSHHNNDLQPETSSNSTSSRDESIASEDRTSPASLRQHEERPSYAAVVSKPPPPAPSSSAMQIKPDSAISTQHYPDTRTRRSSITSVSSVTSTRTDASTKAKLSLTKRIRKVFSLNSISSRYAEDATTGSLGLTNVSPSNLGPSSKFTSRLPRAPSNFTRPASSLGHSVQTGDDTEDEDIPDDAYRKDIELPPSRIVPPRSGTPQPMLRRRSLVNLGSFFSSDKNSKAGSNEPTKQDKANQKQGKDSQLKKQLSMNDIKSTLSDHSAVNKSKKDIATAEGSKIKGTPQRKIDTPSSKVPKKKPDTTNRGILKSGKEMTQELSTKTSTPATKLSPIPGRIPRPIVKTDSSQNKIQTLSSVQLTNQEHLQSEDLTDDASNVSSNFHQEHNQMEPALNATTIPPHLRHYQISHHNSAPNITISGDGKPEPARQTSSPDARTIRRIQFSQSVEFYDTHSANEYDRRCDPNVTCAKLTPLVAMKIKQELNEFKLKEMDVHIDSRMYTHFFL